MLAECVVVAEKKAVLLPLQPPFLQGKLNNTILVEFDSRMVHILHVGFELVTFLFKESQCLLARIKLWVVWHLSKELEFL